MLSAVPWGTSPNTVVYCTLREVLTLDITVLWTESPENGEVLWLWKMGCVHLTIKGGPLWSASQDTYLALIMWGLKLQSIPVTTHAVWCKIIFNGLSELKLCQYCSWKRKGQNRSQLHCRCIKAFYSKVIIFVAVVHSALFLSIICSNSGETLSRS